MKINSIHSTYTLHPGGPSLNACAQALKRVKPDLSRDDFFNILGVPECGLSRSRYWDESYNILPWHLRTALERAHATEVAEVAIRGELR